MQRFQTALPHAEKLAFEDIATSSWIKQKTGPNEWSGRFWVHVGDCVEPARKFCAIRADGQLGEMTVDRFSLCGLTLHPKYDKTPHQDPADRKCIG